MKASQKFDQRNQVTSNREGKVDDKVVCEK